MEVVSIERSAYEVIGLPLRSRRTADELQQFRHKDEGDGQ